VTVLLFIAICGFAIANGFFAQSAVEWTRRHLPSNAWIRETFGLAITRIVAVALAVPTLLAMFVLVAINQSLVAVIVVGGLYIAAMIVPLARVRRRPGSQ
jgi:hypothetical protein